MAATPKSLNIDDPAPQTAHPPESPPSSSSTGDSDVDTDSDNDHEHEFDTLVCQWNVCIHELRRLQEATPASSPIHGLSDLIKAQQQTLDRLLKRKAAGKLSHEHYNGFKDFCWYDRWAVVKKCQELVSIENISFPRNPRKPVAPGAGWIRYKDSPLHEKPVVIDAVVDNGATWLKFMSMSTRNLEFQLVVDMDAESDDDDETVHVRSDSTQTWSDAETIQLSSASTENDYDTTIDWSGHSVFVETIMKIVKAAEWNHCPHVHFVLPRLVEGESNIVDTLLSDLRKRDSGAVKITISCANGKFLTSDAPGPSAAIPVLVDRLEPFVREDCRRLTLVVNLDPSVLASLVSDLHHGPILLQPLAQQKLIIQTQSSLPNDVEETGQVPRNEILAKVLLPALRGRKLVCTESAAKYFRKVIEAISTSSEEVRASLILPPQGAGQVHDKFRLLTEFQKWSNVAIPHDLLLPIAIVDDVTLDEVQPLVSSNKLPPMASQVARDLSPLNRSIYLYGWANGVTTITGHRGIDRQVQLSVATHWTPDPKNKRPPDVWHRLLSGHLFLRDKPKNWQDLISCVVPGGEVPAELVRWTLPWTTWGRGIDANGVPDTKTWPGIGHEEMLEYGRKTERRKRDGETAEGGASES
ncbi:hypothetical protein QBC39DRAFT_358267 [Podospora conica]|nr:hypothetical protein QBC39DRAFT_358267 [Schizothecium conicum]